MPRYIDKLSHGMQDVMTKAPQGIAFKNESVGATRDDYEKLRALGLVDDASSCFAGPGLAMRLTPAGRIVQDLLEVLEEQKSYSQIVWPCKDSSLEGCSATSVAELMIKAGANDAPYADLSENEKPPEESIKFWDEVSIQAKRIAGWTIDGLGINDKARKVSTTSKNKGK